MAWPLESRAQLDLMPYTAVTYEHQSNLFEVSGRQEAIEQTGSERQDDNVLMYLAGLSSRYQFGQQALSLTAEGRRLEYDYFSNIDHDEHLLGGIFDFKLGSIVDGLVQYRQERRVGNFADIQASELRQQFDRTLSGRIGLAVTPKWRVEAGARRYRSELPLPENPKFQLDESAGQLALQYTGLSHLTAGLLAQYVKGDYTGSADATSYNENSLQLTADYAVADFNTFNLRLGATQRRLSRNEDVPGADQRDDRVDGFTGAVGYTRIFSPKTSANFEVFRRIDNFVAGTDALIDTGVSAGVNWQATAKMSLSARYAYTRSDFGNNGLDQNRDDRLNNGSFELNYDVLRWLRLRPYVVYRDRDSTSQDDSFSNTLVGLELRAHFGDEPNS